MTAAVNRMVPRFAGIAAFLLVWVYYYGQVTPWRDLLGSESVRSFKTVWISILLEAMPFMLLGVAGSSLVQLFVSEQTIRRLVPRHAAAGVVFACLLGFLFPLCECGMVPVVRRLARKGMPVYIAVVLILAGPVLNPIVFASTYMAFRGQPEMAYARLGLAFAVALIVGLLLASFLKKTPLRDSEPDRHEHPQTFVRRVKETLYHASDEFFDMGKYLIIGSMLAAAFQTFVSRESLLFLGQGEWSSHLFMLGLAYALSLCSTSDAFVAASFAASFTKGSLLTFLVFGPMMDVKGTLMLLSAFHARFVLLLLAVTAALALAGSLLAERLFFH